jgi:hypothetical protein
VRVNNVGCTVITHKAQFVTDERWYVAVNGGQETVVDLVDVQVASTKLKHVIVSDHTKLPPDPPSSFSLHTHWQHLAQSPLSYAWNYSALRTP